MNSNIPEASPPQFLRPPHNKGNLIVIAIILAVSMMAIPFLSIFLICSTYHHWSPVLLSYINDTHSMLWIGGAIAGVIVLKIIGAIVTGVIFLIAVLVAIISLAQSDKKSTAIYKN